MATAKRAGISAQSFESLHVTLPERREIETPPVSGNYADESGSEWTGSAAHNVSFPSLARPKREKLVPSSLRLPASQIARLEHLKQTRGVTPSELVRDFVEAGLAALAKECPELLEIAKKHI